MLLNRRKRPKDGTEGHLIYAIEILLNKERDGGKVEIYLFDVGEVVTSS